MMRLLFGRILLLLIAVSSRGCVALSSLLQRTVQNWVSIAQHLQSDLYDASWADWCEWKKKNGKNRLVCTRRVESQAMILSLYPIDAIDIEKGYDADDDCSTARRYHLPPLDADWYRDSGVSSDTRLSVEAFLTTGGGDLHPSGWLGHLAASVTPKRNAKGGNCLIVPLLGAAPLCALVSLGPIEEGDILVLEQFHSQEYHEDDRSIELDWATQVLIRYSSEISELRSFTTMAHPPFETELPSNKEESPQYHPIYQNHPGLQSLHQNPDVFQIDSFLTPTECQELIAKSRPHLQPCLVKNAETGAVEPDPTRSSTNANVPQSEIPSIVTKVCHLVQCQPDHLELFQILHYTPGQQFSPHTDGFDGPVSACGFEHSGRLVTVFCYLNDCPAGGETSFPRLGIQVTPQQGRAVVHFPTSINFREDLRTEHESVPVVTGEKWLLVTWMWKHVRSDPRYHEAVIPALSQSII